MKEALFYTKFGENNVKCQLCPHFCIIHDGNTGNCKVRSNFNGTLYADNYGKISGYHLDPVEKKPLYHFYPGKFILSLGSFGCNMHCKFCQNYEISQCGANNERHYELSPDSVVNDSLRKENNIGIAYTYNEPLVYYEFMRDTALLTKQYGLKNVMVSNGFFNPEPLEKMLLFIDAFSVDLKAFTDEFYKKYTASNLEEVKKSLARIKEAGKHLEITNLIIPGLNDDKMVFTKMMEWIQTELGKNTILHISRYFPRYKMDIQPTPEKTLLNLYEVALQYVDFVYVGNFQASGQQNTYCPSCKTLLVKRNGYAVEKQGLKPDGTCAKCNTKVFDYL